MNSELLKAKMAEYFNRVSPEYLIEKYEQMGYTFVDAYVPWDCVNKPLIVRQVVGRAAKIPWYKAIWQQKPTQTQNKLTSEYPGSFFIY